MRKTSALALIIVLVASGLMLVESASAQSSYPAITEFSLKYVDHSYDVAPTTTSSTDPYTGKTTTTTTPGYHVENKTIEVVIKNPSGASYYNFRYKGHYEDKWTYYPFSPSSSGYSLGDTYSVPYQASTSSYTVAALPSYFVQSITQGGEGDVQVQALYGSFRAVPYGHIQPIPGGPTYDFYFEGETSEWSSTQTITIPETSPSPSVPELSTFALFPLLIAVPLIAFFALRKKPIRKHMAGVAG
ncbi:MAG: hypothetical protein M1540_05820 [Candidatus Bathyarchaeota archaeon]|nr:hypothetical protein [Candidatus Bathyarchaeota archaeon]